MQIYLLRHGAAEDASASVPDPERALTAEGRKKTRAVVRQAAAAGVKTTLILSSPYKRAVGTAKIAVEVLGAGGEILQTKSLTPGADPEDVWEEIRVHRDEEGILLAGHEPLFSHLTAYLLGAPELQVDFKKSGLVAIEIDNFGAKPHGTLRWMIIPRLVSE